ncbi:MAG: phosphatase PAP2 family protein [Planctomycetaceae bacterium]
MIPDDRAETHDGSLSTVPEDEGGFWGWPGWRHGGEACALGLLITLWFCLVYGIADHVTGLRSSRIRVHSSFELGIPFVPAAVLGYVSVFPLMWMAPFILRTRGELRAFAWMLAAVTLIAGAGFLLIPAELAFPPQRSLGNWAELMRFVEWSNLTYNLVPSLHVTYGVACAEVYAGKARRGGRLAVRAWAGIIAVSTVLTHQHHLLDVAAGMGLGIAGGRLVSGRLTANWKFRASRGSGFTPSGEDR